MTATAATTPSAEEAPSTTTGTPCPGPLAGIKVLDISTVYAAPITAMLLGDLDTDVTPGATATGRPTTRRATPTC
jgi:crotonobetainyl-CoA:carnitine CoA-transferase CaiB-like acyl-CoA transferase